VSASDDETIGIIIGALGGDTKEADPELWRRTMALDDEALARLLAGIHSASTPPPSLGSRPPAPQ
jgi:hypothetical protein